MKKQTNFVKNIRKHPLKIVIILILSLSILGFYALRNDIDLMRKILTDFTYPVRVFLSEVFSVFDFSVAELFYTVGIALFLVSIILIIIFHRLGKVTNKGISSFAMSVIIVLLLVWSSICWLQNVTYYGDTMEVKAGIELRDINVEELYNVADKFVEEAAALSEEIPRDENGNFIYSGKEILSQSLKLYPKLIEDYNWDFLERSNLPVKAVKFSEIVSATGSSGFYFPLTGETNMNMDSPNVFLPVITAHEMAHQRFIAEESSANFVGIMACINSDDPVFQYSGYMLGLMYLEGALESIYTEDEEDMPEGYPNYYELVKEKYTEIMISDFEKNTEFWDSHRGWFRDLFKAVYSSYLQENGQKKSTHSYSSCIYYLTVWFTDYE